MRGGFKHFVFFLVTIWRLLDFTILKTVPVIFVVDPVVSYYCIYYENYWNSLYLEFCSHYRRIRCSYALPDSYEFKKFCALNMNIKDNQISHTTIRFSCPNCQEFLQRHMFYPLNSLNIVRLLTEQTRAAQLPLSSQSESMYYAKKMDFWLINLIVIYNNQSC